MVSDIPMGIQLIMAQEWSNLLEEELVAMINRGTLKFTLNVSKYVNQCERFFASKGMTFETHGDEIRAFIQETFSLALWLTPWDFACVNWQNVDTVLLFLKKMLIDKNNNEVFNR